MKMKIAVMAVVQAHFRPEFVNRIDEIVVFHPLDKAQIAHDRAHPVCSRWSSALPSSTSGIDVERHGAASCWAMPGFDPVYGARPLKRAIQQQFENPLAQKILSGAFVSGDTIKVDAEGGQLVFVKG